MSVPIQPQNMKKAKSGTSATEKQPLSSSTKAVIPAEKAKSDQGSSGRKNSGGGDKNSKPLGKAFLSKSQDNLASQLRRKAAAAALSKDGNKENVTLKDKVATQTPKSKPPKGGVTPIRKAQSTPHIDKSGTPMKRAQSAQNIDKTPGPQNNSKPSGVKKASSAQNISRDKSGTRQVRISAPENIMAYNAELLASFEKEKKTLERRISELIQVAEMRKTEIEKYKFEVKNLREKLLPYSELDELEMMRNENRLLKDRLHELGVSVEHITDSEKLSLLQKANSTGGSHNDAKGAMGGLDSSSGIRSQSTKGDMDFCDINTTDSELGLSVGDLTCITPDHPSSLSLDNSNWDRQSNKSSDAMSEISVACLQDRILQMEETHYSTNEELQATLQELSDMQDAVNDLTSENERLADERSVLLESLCAQTEKLENCRMQIEHLKALLVSESEGADRSENEKQLVALVKSAQEEREELMLKQVELSNSLHGCENEIRELQDIVTALRDKTQIQEMKNESAIADKRALEAQAQELKETSAKDQIEIQRYRTLLENERTKVAELEQYKNASDKSDLEELLDNTRQEKDKVEAKLTNVQEELAVSQNEVLKLQEQLLSLEEELKVSKNNAKTQVSDLQFKMDQTAVEKVELQEEIGNLRDHIDQLQLDCDRYLEEKKTHNAMINDLQTDLKVARSRVNELESDIRDTQTKFVEEKEEWKQFQADLQTAVVIANEFKMEAQEDTDKIKSENVTFKERNQQLLEEMSKLQEEVDKMRHAREKGNRDDIRGRVINTMDRELAALRQGRKVSDPKGGKECLSVKNLIASIEQQVKTERGTPPLSPVIASENSSRRNSTDSTLSMGSLKSPESPVKSPIERRSSVPADTSYKSVLRKPSDTKESRTPLSHRHTITNIIYEKAPPVTDDAKAISPPGNRSETDSGKKPLTSILSNKSSMRKNSITEAEKSDKTAVVHSVHGANRDPLAHLAKQMGGSKRNALLKWCQNKTAAYSDIDITNFSSSWNDGLAFCAIMHSYLPQKVPYKELNTQDKRRNFTLAFKAAESVGIPSSLAINDMVAIERPDWQAVMSYVTSIYKHFEIDS